MRGRSVGPCELSLTRVLSPDVEEGDLGSKRDVSATSVRAAGLF